MVPIRFAWPYGGRQVFLTGSFRSWIEYSPMTLLEGSSTVFQTVCNLAPGSYQYKFLVDGIWRIDEQQPHAPDDYGTVNNIIHVKELELIPSLLRPEATVSSLSMEIDNGVVQHPASSSGSMHRVPMLQMSHFDIDVSRRRVAILLSNYTTYELLPESGKVFALDVKMPVKQAFHIMHEQGLPVAPVWDDSKKQISGMLTSSDFILILTELHKNGSTLTNEELEMHSISAWKEGKFQILRKSYGPVQPPFQRPLILASPQDSLKDVALRILGNKISTVPVINSTQHGSCQQLLHIACLSGILKYICRHFRHSVGTLPVLQQPIGALPLGTWAPKFGKASGCQLRMLQPSDCLSSALNLLLEAQISAIPIVDGDGSLLDMYSRSDIMSLAKDSAYACIRLDQTNLHQALQLGYEANTAFDAHRRCRTCLYSDSLLEVMERLSDPAVRRLIIIEAGSKCVEGIISLRDVFNFFLG